jgi:hypothetical protein
LPVLSKSLSHGRLFLFIRFSIIPRGAHTRARLSDITKDAFVG